MLSLVGRIVATHVMNHPKGTHVWPRDEGLPKKGDNVKFRGLTLTQNGAHWPNLAWYSQARRSGVYLR
jgi:hypothetical protein